MSTSGAKDDVDLLLLKRQFSDGAHVSPPRAPSHNPSALIKRIGEDLSVAKQNLSMFAELPISPPLMGWTTIGNTSLLVVVMFIVLTFVVIIFRKAFC